MPSSPTQGIDRLTRLRQAFRCVACRGALEDGDTELRCGACGARYPVVAGRPVLMSPAKRNEFGLRLETADGQRMAEEYTRGEQGVAKSSPWRWLKPPSIMYRYRPDLLLPPTDILFKPVDGRPPLTLSVGGGPHRLSATDVNLNIGPFPDVDLVADAHDIPLADACIDAVFSLAVLEHVVDPQRVVAEMIRVLKPGGVLYSEIPFMFFFHGYPSDYRRFTREGMRLLFAELEAPEIGMTHGPVSALLQSANMLIDLAIPKTRPRLRKLCNGAFRGLFFPFKYLDIPLRNHPDAHILAGGFYVLGRKAGRP